MKIVVVTGSTRGLGFGLAEAFLNSSCRVVICGRRQESVELAVESLSERHSGENVFGLVCNVQRSEQVQNLWDGTVEHFGQVDIWINNAGIAGQRRQFWEQGTAEIDNIIGTNLVGAMYGSRVAILGMLQQGFGALYMVEGAGSDGRRMVDGMNLYGTSKYGLRYFTEALVEETRGTPVLVGSLSPGMVLTDLLTKEEQEHPEEWERSKRIFNILADRVETVAPWLAEQVLQNNRTGVTIKWLTRSKVLLRFLGSPFSKRDIFAKKP